MRTIVLTLLLGVALLVPAAAKEDDRLATIHLPEGFVIEAFAAVPNARQMAWGEKGTLFVGIVGGTGGQLAAALAVGAALVGSVLRFNAMQLMGAVGVGIAAGAGTGIVTGLVGTAIV